LNTEELGLVVTKLLLTKATDQGYIYSVWDPPSPYYQESEEYNPREATEEEMDNLIGDSAAYEELLQTESVVGCIVFEIPQEQTPVEVSLAHVPPVIKLTVPPSEALEPANFEVSNLRIVPAEVGIGNPVEISVLVRNKGDMQGTYTVTLKIDNETESTENVTLGGGASENVSFTVTKSVVGTYTVDVNGLGGSFSVVEAVVEGTLEVHFIDVEQGDSTYIRTPTGKDVLIDGGDSDQGSKVVGYLQNQGVDDIELMIATHPHADHVGGLISVLDAYVVEEVWDPGFDYTTTTYQEFLTKVGAEGCPFSHPRRGQTVDIDPDLGESLLNPPDPFYDDANSCSIVLQITFGQSPSCSPAISGPASRATSSPRAWMFRATSSR
jgi:hypothetical protein